MEKTKDNTRCNLPADNDLNRWDVYLPELYGCFSAVLGFGSDHQVLLVHRIGTASDRAHLFILGRLRKHHFVGMTGFPMG
jgi:hypothetical protein